MKTPRLIEAALGRGDWAVCVISTGETDFFTDVRTHTAMAVRHLPQSNAATVMTDLSEHLARRLAARINALNEPAFRAEQRASFEARYAPTEAT